MKKIFSLLFVGASVFLLHTAALSQATDTTALMRTQPAKPASPSLEETLIWLKDKLTVAATFTPVYPDGRVSPINFGFEPLIFSGCNVSWKQRIGVRGLPTTFNLVSLSLSEIDAAKIADSRAEGKIVWSVDIATIDDKRVIKVQILSESGKVERILDTNSHSLNVRDGEAAARIAKALIHAATVCRTHPQPEPF